MTLLKSSLFLAVFAFAACGTPDTQPGDGGTGGGSGGGTAGGTGGGTAGGTGGGTTAAAPAVTGTLPRNSATEVPLNARLSATFNVAMEPTSISDATFLVKQGTASLTGAVSLSGATANFVPTSNFVAGGTYTATLTTSVKSVSGKALPAAFSWTFTAGTSSALGPVAVNLGTAGNYAVLAKTAVSTVPTSKVTGDVALSPAAATFLTGFSLVADATNVFASSTQVVGQLYAANYAAPTPTVLTTAVSNMENAYVDAASRPTPDQLELGTGAIGGLTLAPGLYKWTSSVTAMTNVTLSGGANDVWIFQTSGDFTVGAAVAFTLTGGALAKNVFWQVAGQATFGAGSHVEGVVLSKTGITLQTGASLNGRALAQTMVALQQATVAQPAP